VGRNRNIALACQGALIIAGVLGARAQSVIWEPISIPQRSTAGHPEGAQTWQSIEPEGSRRQAPVWVPLVDGAKIGNEPLPQTKGGSPQEPPTEMAEAEAILQSLKPSAAEYTRLLRLGPAVPTANQLAEQQGQFSAYTLSPFSGGSANGTGNQNYAVRVDGGVTDALQISGFYSNADDPLFARIQGLSKQPANFWESYGGALQWHVHGGKNWGVGLSGSLEGWNVGSGGCYSFGCKSNANASPNIFNNSGQRVFTKNLVGSVSIPLTWNIGQQWQATLTPGVSFLPPSQGEGQGGAGTFYGTNGTISGGLSWQPSRHLSLFGSALIPLGPGDNSFDSSLTFSRVPILSGGANWALNPRIGLEGLLTNGWGATPATALLALPSSNRLGYYARFVYTPGAADTPQLKLSPRQESMALGGLTVNTALVPEDGVTELWANADSGGNIFGFIGHSISNIFQVDVFKSGWFNNIPQTTALADRYTTDGAWQWRIGGKAVALSPLRGFPLWAAGRISLGRENPPGSGQGYVFAETINTWEANRWLAFHVNPKLAWSGVGVPWGFGIGANIQLGGSFQLIPEANLVASEIGASNATLALRWLANHQCKVDVYLSNAAGLLDMGQLLSADQTRVGGRLIISF